MKKFTLLLLALAFSVLVAGTSAAETHPSGKPVQGTLKTDNPWTVQDGEKYWFQFSALPENTQTRLWVDNGDGKGFQDFGIFRKDEALPGVHKTLNCSRYEYLEPGKLLSVGNRDLFVKFYLEYVGLNKVSNVSWSVHDCSQAPAPQSTGNPIFPYTLESVYGRNNNLQPFPDAYASGMSSPLKKFAGRYLDGQDSGGINAAMGFEWYKLYGTATSGGNGGEVKVSGNRIYTALGSTMAAYNKDTFISRLANKTNSSLALFKGTSESYHTDLKKGYPQSALPWDAYVYPEHPDNAWLWGRGSDTHTGLTGYNVDDRGYIYLIDRWGFGIVRDDGSALRIIVQIGDKGGLLGDPLPTLPLLRTGRNGTVKFTDMNGYGDPHTSDADEVNIVKTGGKYYAVITGLTTGGVNTGKNGTRVLDVTDVNNPQFFRSNPGEYISELVQSGDTVAVIAIPLSSEGFPQKNSEIRIYNAADFIFGTAPKKVFSVGSGSAQYLGLAVDKTNGKFYSIGYSSTPRPSSSVPTYILPTTSLSVFSPGTSGAASYTEKKHELTNAVMGGKSNGINWAGYEYVYTVSGLDFNNGYLVSRGQSPEGPGDVKIWIFKNGQPEELSTRGFIREYYSHNPASPILLASVHTLAGKDYLFLGGYHMADVYELEPVSRDTTTPSPTEICGNNLDDDGDGQKDEGCAPTPPLPPPPPGSTSCTASISFDKTSVAYGGSAT
ncbi:MAG: hypothetical protein UY01_C0023G0004, partial [Candidatus Nomurabacteria bacterium GW2011_GWB1_47_6]